MILCRIVSVAAQHPFAVPQSTRWSCMEPKLLNFSATTRKTTSTKPLVKMLRPLRPPLKSSEIPHRDRILSVLSCFRTMLKGLKGHASRFSACLISGKIYEDLRSDFSRDTPRRWSPQNWMLGTAAQPMKTVG